MNEVRNKTEKEEIEFGCQHLEKWQGGRITSKNI